jgi:hypothetical protein
MKRLVLFLAVLALALSAADVAGTWKASMETPNGNFETTFTFKVDGTTLTGKVASQRGESDISNGKVDGDNISFSVKREFNGQEFTMNYKGKVSGSEMKLQMQFPGRDEPIEMTAKKVS